VQVIETNNRKKLVKSTRGQYIHWNQELRLYNDILNPRKFPNVFDRKENMRRPDIWFYSKEKKGERTELVLNLIEVTIPWENAVINEDKIRKIIENKNILETFKKEDSCSNTLADARDRKENKYQPIIEEAKR
jgi:hypothetical protein